MIMCEQDSDVYRWGLHLLCGDQHSITGYSGATQNDASLYDGDYPRESNFGTDTPSIENDEIIAHALQEEFSQVAVAEAHGPPNAGVEHLHASVLAQDWFGSSTRNSCSVNGNFEEADDMEPSSSCSSPGGKSYEGDELSIELVEDFLDLDAEVGKRLNQMVPIPHVLRTNGEIPSVDEATSDHQRLLNRLQLYDLVELKVQGDGNCQFRALSDQLYHTPEHHKFVRQQVVNQLRSHPESYEGYVPMAYSDYLKKMSKSGEWGDHVTLQAAADSPFLNVWNRKDYTLLTTLATFLFRNQYGVRLFVITSFKDTCYIEILPSVPKSKRVIILSFWAEVHYNSIYPEGELPKLEMKKKKRWWTFGNTSH